MIIVMLLNVTGSSRNFLVPNSGMIFNGLHILFLFYLNLVQSLSIYVFKYQVFQVPTILTLMVSVCDFQAKGFPFLFISVIAIPKKNQNFVQFCR